MYVCYFFFIENCNFMNCSNFKIMRYLICVKNISWPNNENALGKRIYCGFLFSTILYLVLLCVSAGIRSSQTARYPLLKG